jgi:hypothetical protein
MRFRPFQRLMFRTMSQITLNYRRGPLSAGRAGPVEGGDRLPWAILVDGQTNLLPLRSLAWQVHVYGEPAPSVAAICAAHGLSLHRLRLPGAEKAEAGRGQGRVASG